jgi:hypothetical protein
MGQRKAATIAAATIAVAAVVTAGLLGVRYVNASNVVATPPPSPTSSSLPTTPAPSPTATEPPGPPVREANIDDATVEARIVAPRTGETWTTPTAAPEMASLLAQGMDGWVPYLVGHRGSAGIYVVVNEGNNWTTAMIAEVDASGARQISCPSARSTDACVASAGVPGVTLDTSTFYDSLTLPESIDIGAGWALDTSAVGTTTSYGDALFLLSYADPSFAIDGVAYLPVANVGGLRVLEWASSPESDGTGSDLDVRSYVLVAPTGLMYQLGRQLVPGADYESIRWDDGVTRTEDAAFGADSYGGGSRGCMVGEFSVQPDLDRSQWSRAGQTREGASVYVPTKANPLVHTIRSVQVDMADVARQNGGYPGADENRAYPFASDAAFRDAHALYAVAGPDGVWQIRLRGDAVVQPDMCGD